MQRWNHLICLRLNVIILLALAAPILIVANPEGEKSTKAGIIPEWKERGEILRKMQAVMGEMPRAEKQVPLDMRVEESEECDGFIRQRISYAAEPGDRVPAYLLLPKGISEKRKGRGVLALHQTHRLGNKVVVGLGESPDDEYGVELARRGYVCIAPVYPLLAEYAPDLKQLGWKSGTLKAVWNNMRALDLLCSLGVVETNGFISIGHSLGGHNGLFTAAFDRRIAVVVTSCGFDSFKDYMNGNISGWTSERYMPQLLTYPRGEYPFDFPDVLRAIYPRAVFVSAPKGDSNFKWESVARIADELKSLYAAAGAEELFTVRFPDVDHRFPAEMRAEAYAFMERALPVVQKRFR
jgi:pimeloyl-ACP methyl ester carboxylesterase